MSMVLSHRTALELYRSSMMPVSGYESSHLPQEKQSLPGGQGYAASNPHFPYTASLCCAQAKES